MTTRDMAEIITRNAADDATSTLDVFGVRYTVNPVATSEGGAVLRVERWTPSGIPRSYHKITIDRAATPEAAAEAIVADRERC